jgi:3-deoxy-D-manno-octulosonic-acid transferase
VVLNARSSPRSHARWRKLRPISRRLVGSLGFAVAQESIYGARLADLGLPRQRIAVSGSLKADMVQPAAPDAADREATRIALPDGPLLLLSSTSDPEERPLLAAWREQLRGGGWRCVLVPRHPERAADIVQLAGSLGLPARRTSQSGTAGLADELIVVDEIGRLGGLYALCAARGGIAVVGGSLGSGRGGQNMLEAAAAGCCTVVGWDTTAQPDPMRLLRGAGAVVELRPETLANTLAQLASDHGRRDRLGATARTAWASGRGALTRTVRILGRAGLPLDLAPDVAIVR